MQRGTGAWIYLELTEEQQRLVRERTGHIGCALALTFSEFAAARFFVERASQSNAEAARRSSGDSAAPCSA